MRVQIEFDVPRWSQWRHITAQIVGKIYAQLARPPALCTEPEGPDLLFDVNGNRVGTITVVVDDDDMEEEHGQA